ncbi:MAG TPA: hypothetical protein DDY78_13310, partial [Planctomycetales bacterium]|nr:hypothetical protein [Planctomycetales bacterium]
NSATAVKPWRQLYLLVARRLGGGFNSATAVKPWRHHTQTVRWQVQLALQFGHGGEAVETVAMVMM